MTRTGRTGRTEHRTEHTARPGHTGHAERTGLDALFDPRSVAVVGASGNPEKWGYWLASGALEGRDRRTVHLVNRRGGELHGVRFLPGLDELSDPPEHVVVAVPPRQVRPLVVQGLAAGARCFTVITSGGTSADEERELASLVTAGGARLLGPNCMGVVDTTSRLRLSWGDFPAGAVGLVSQSGNPALEIGRLLARAGQGFSRFVSLGNQRDIDAADALDALLAHGPTRIVAAYVEDFRDGRRLARTLAAAHAAGKPVLLLTVGRSEASGRAAASHTGALVSARAAVEAVCRDAGALLLDTAGELVDTAVCLLAAPLRGPAPGAGAGTGEGAGADTGTSTGVGHGRLAGRGRGKLGSGLPGRSERSGQSGQSERSGRRGARVRHRRRSGACAFVAAVGRRDRSSAPQRHRSRAGLRVRPGRRPPAGRPRPGARCGAFTGRYAAEPALPPRRAHRDARTGGGSRRRAAAPAGRRRRGQRGQGALAADALTAHGLDVPGLSAGTSREVAACLPPSAACANPVDLDGAGEADLGTYARIVRALLSGGDTDAVVLTGYFGDYTTANPAQADRECAVAHDLADAALESGRRLVVHTMARDSPALAVLRGRAVPVYERIEQAAASLAMAARLRAAVVEAPPEPPPPAPYAVPGGGYETVRELLASYGLAFPAAGFVTTADEAAAAARLTGYPLALKAMGPAHKTEAGGVALGITDEGRLRSAFAGMRSATGAARYAVEAMAFPPYAVELIVGVRRDPAFGPVAMAGIGGVTAELLADTAVALAPLTADRARALLLSLRHAPLLTGWRGSPPVHLDAAAAALCALARAGAEHPELSELEVNPLLVHPGGAIALDAHGVLR